MDKKGKSSPARLSVQVTQHLTSAVAGKAMKEAQMSVHKLSQPFVSNVSNAFTNISDTVSNQQNLVASFTALMQKLQLLVKIGDKVAKVCSSVSPLL